jgi:hypothetical protein
MRWQVVRFRGGYSTESCEIRSSCFAGNCKYAAECYFVIIVILGINTFVPAVIYYSTDTTLR